MRAKYNINVNINVSVSSSLKFDCGIIKNFKRMGSFADTYTKWRMDFERAAYVDRRSKGNMNV